MFEAVARIAGHHIKTPGQRAGFGIVGREETAHAEISAAVADDDFAFHHARGAGDGVETLPTGGIGAPDFFAGAGVECNQASIEGADIHFAIPEGDAAIDRFAAAIAQPLARHLWIVGPQLFAAARIEGEYAAPTGADIDHT